MAKREGGLRKAFAQGRLPLGLSLGILGLAWIGSIALLRVEQIWLQRDMEPAVRRQETRDGYTFLLIHPKNFSPATSQKLIDGFFATYPRQAARFNPQACRQVTLVFEPMDGVLKTGPTLGEERHMSSSYLASKPQDLDVVTFELFRIVQNYPRTYVGTRYPDWIWQGLADYARHTYGINNAAAGWSLGEYKPEQRYTDSYRVTARFFTWMEKRVQPHLLEDLDQTLREGTFTDAFWMQHTGKSIDQLWATYALDPRL